MKTRQFFVDLNGNDLDQKVDPGFQLHEISNIQLDNAQPLQLLQLSPDFLWVNVDPSSLDLPPAKEYVVLDMAARNAIPPEERYEGMIVYVQSVGETYQLVGGIDDIHWDAFASPDPTAIDGGTWS